MLAYVFWHVRRPGIEAPDYEAAHRAFHDALWAASVGGLLGLRVHRLVEIPWLEPRQQGYEDWHLIQDSGVLDALNEAAVTSARQAAHDRVAGMAAGGTAGLYALRLGQAVEPSMAYWLAKPAGMSYADFHRTLRPLVDAGCCLWGRRMTLGPTPEFCLHSAAEVVLPHPALALKIETLHRRGQP